MTKKRPIDHTEDNANDIRKPLILCAVTKSSFQLPTSQTIGPRLLLGPAAFLLLLYSAVISPQS